MQATARTIASAAQDAPPSPRPRPLPSPSNAPGGIIDCYVRNSSALQVDNWRAEYQKEQLPLICEHLGYTPEVHEEQGKSGESLANRKVMQAILERVRAGRVRGIATVSFDRLSRDIDLIDGLEIWRTCKEANAVIVTPDKVWRPGEDNDDDLAFINFWLAGRRKRQQLHDLYQGLTRKASEEPLFRGRVPYGYMRVFEEIVDHRGRRKAQAKWVIDPETAPVVRWIFAEYPRHSVRWLATTLNERDETWWRKRWNNDGTFTRVPWYTNDLCRLVKKTIYCGIIRWGVDVQSKRVQALMLAHSPDGRAFQHTHPELAIVTEEQWAACQVDKPGDPRRVKDGGMAPRSAGTEAVFVGLLHCPRCDSVMYASTQRVKSAYADYRVPAYICGNYHRGGTALCTPHQTREREVMEAVRTLLQRLLADVDPTAELVDTFAQQETAAKRTMLEQEQERINEGKARLFADRYQMALVSDDEFARIQAQLNTRSEQIERELDQLEIVSLPALREKIALFEALVQLRDPEDWQAAFPVPETLPRSEGGGVTALSEEDLAHWKHAMHVIFRRITLGYEAHGRGKRADVWIDSYELAPEVEEALALGRQARAERLAREGKKPGRGKKGKPSPSATFIKKMVANDHTDLPPHVRVGHHRPASCGLDTWHPLAPVRLNRQWATPRHYLAAAQRSAPRLVGRALRGLGRNTDLHRAAELSYR